MVRRGGKGRSLPKTGPKVQRRSVPGSPPRAVAFAGLLAGTACLTTACSGGDPWDQPPRFVVVDRPSPNVPSTLVAAVAWIPAGDPVTLPVTDGLDVPAIAEDFAWSPAGPPPAEALRHCTELCDPNETIALGWFVAYEDVDGDGAGRLVLPATSPWSAADAVMEGPDRIVGLATDHVLAFAPADLAAGGGLAQRLGWPVQQGAWVMSVRPEDGKDLLRPVVSRERVSLYLMPRPDPIPGDTEEGGLLCADEDGAADEIHCPTFQGQGDRVD